MQCNKCQLYRHMARECKQAHKTCAYCTDNHRTNDCKNKEIKFCKPCNMAGHSLLDRICPVFNRKCEEYNKRNPGNSLPFFPTCEPWTCMGGDPLLTATTDKAASTTNSHKQTLSDDCNKETPPPAHPSMNDHGPNQYNKRPNNSHLRIIQTNLCKSQAMHMAIINNNLQDDWDILPVQEPHTNYYNHISMPSGFRQVYSETNPRKKKAV